MGITLCVVSETSKIEFHYSETGLSMLSFSDQLTKILKMIILAKLVSSAQEYPKRNYANT